MRGASCDAGLLSAVETGGTRDPLPLWPCKSQRKSRTERHLLSSLILSIPVCGRCRVTCSVNIPELCEADVWLWKEGVSYSVAVPLPDRLMLGAQA